MVCQLWSFRLKVVARVARLRECTALFNVSILLFLRISLFSTQATGVQIVHLPQSHNTRILSRVYLDSKSSTDALNLCVHKTSSSLFAQLPPLVVSPPAALAFPFSLTPDVHIPPVPHVPLPCGHSSLLPPPCNSFDEVLHRAWFHTSPSRFKSSASCRSV